MGEGSRLRKVNQDSEENEAINLDPDGVEDEADDDEIEYDIKNKLKGDRLNICLLLLLYVLQGVPLGLSAAVPLILQNRNITYGQQAIFSLASWPFAIKLLWAPCVDSIFNKRFGRRKSWLVPSQYLIGISMLLLSYYIDDLMGSEKSKDIPVKIYELTLAFGSLHFLAATQDIAVDGWALTMLQRRNVGYVSTCNTVGQTFGWFIGSTIFLALESGEFCNKFLWFLYINPSEMGLVTLSSFLLTWGIIFIIITSLIMILKRETDHLTLTDEDDVGLLDSYVILYKISKLPSIRVFVVLLLTCKIGFSVSDSITGLKLVEHGVKKEYLGMIAVPMIPLKIIYPWILSKWTTGRRPLDAYIISYPLRMLFGFVAMAIVYWTVMIKDPEVPGSFPWYYYLILVSTYFLRLLVAYPIYVAEMAFFAKVSDPTIGGTYMTFLNTITNLGANWPGTLALSTVDYLNIRSCDMQTNSSMIMNNSSMVISNSSTILNNSSAIMSNSTTTMDDSPTLCPIMVDGFYIQSLIVLFIGFVWFFAWGKRKLVGLQALPPSAWAVKK